MNPINPWMKIRGFSSWTILAVAFLSSSALPAFGQTDRGAIEGKVVDASGAVVAGATVTITNNDTGVANSVTVDNAGEYQVLTLSPGKYSIKVTAQGFETAVQNDVEVHVQDRLNLDFSLKVGSVGEEVVVTTGEPVLQTQNADLGSVVSEQQINDLPLNGRRYADLALLEPGVQKDYTAANPAPDRFSVNGNLELQNDFLLNGIYNNYFSENI